MKIIQARLYFQANTSNAVGKKGKNIDPSLVRARVIRETKNIPNLVAKMETLMGDLQKLSSKVKNTKLLEGIKLATTRDFRIKLDQVPTNEEDAEVHNISFCTTPKVNFSQFFDQDLFKNYIA